MTFIWGISRRAAATQFLIAGFIALAICASTVQAAEVRPWTSSYDWRANGVGYQGWQTSRLGPNPDGYGQQSALGGIPGLWTWLVGGMEYRPGESNWQIAAPGTTTFQNARLDLSYREKFFAHHCLAFQLRDAGETRAEARNCSPPGEDGVHRAVIDAGVSPAKHAVFTAFMPDCNNPLDQACSKWIPVLDPLKNGGMVRLDHVTFTLNDYEVPAVNVGGPFVSIRGQYVDGKSDFELDFTASDPGSGVKAVASERLGDGTFTMSEPSCDPNHNSPGLAARVCPDSYTAKHIAPVSGLPEGRHEFRGRATDLSGHEKYAEVPLPIWEVFVDRTGPTQPSHIAGLYAPSDEEESEPASASIIWESGEDQNLSDGAPGSGLAFDEVRIKRTGQDWGDWVQTDQEELPIQSPDADELIEVEIRSLDHVLNKSIISSKSVRLGEIDESEEDPTPLAEHIANAHDLRASMGMDTSHSALEQLETSPPDNESIREFGIPLSDSEFAEMQARGRIDRRMAQLVAYGKAHARDNFAGAWVDYSQGNEIYVAFKEDASDHVETISGTFVNASRLRAVDADRSIEDLDGLQRRIRTEVSYWTGRGIRIARLGRHHASNQVAVHVIGMNDAAKQALVERYGEGVLVLAAPDVPREVRHHGVGYGHDSARYRRRSRVAAGLALTFEHDWSCTSNVSAFRGSRHFVVTAGHCVVEYERDGSQIVNMKAWLGSESGLYLGRTYSNHGWESGTDADWGLINVSKARTDSRLWLRDQRNRPFHRGIIAVAPRETALPGNVLCYSGLRRMRTRCGAVIDNPADETSVAENFEDFTVSDYIDVSIRTHGGDSGGPLFQRIGRTSASIVGILSSGDDRNSSFSPMDLAAERGDFTVCLRTTEECK